MRGPRQPRVGQMQRSSLRGGGDFQSTRGNLQQRLIHCFICSNLVSRSPLCFLYCFVSIPVPIVTCLHGNSCVILAEAMIWSSRRSSWTLPRGPDLHGSSANPHQGAEALQIICVNFYGKCLCKVMHTDLHLSFMQGWRYTCARWKSISFGHNRSAVGALAPDTVERFFFFYALVQCLILSLSICTVFSESRTAPSLHLCTLWFGRTGFGLSSVSLSPMCHLVIFSGGVVGLAQWWVSTPGWRLSEEAVLPTPVCNEAIGQ